MRRYLYITAVLVAIAVIAGYSPRPAAYNYQQTESHAIAFTEDTALKHAVESPIQAHPGQSGFHLITHGSDALLIRIAMIQAAQRSLDLQYYSIQDDKTGKLLLEAILRAADRGVRVRILVDDITFKKSDPTWSLLDTHPHIELRVFNPFATRDQSILSRIGNIFTALGRFDKRMHNKVFIADNQLALIGGRNLGDAYFDNSQDVNFRDVDILAAGPITPRVSESFDHFWNGKEAYPISAVSSTKRDMAAITQLRETLKTHWQEAAQDGTLARIPPIIAQLQNGDIPLIWADAELAADSPAKVDIPKEHANSKPASWLETLADNAKYEFIAVSPYFVPGKEGVEWLKALTSRGVKIRILTNSLASTDVVAVHVGYRRYRKAVIADGVELYEMKPLPGKYPRTGRFSSASHASLHTKVYIVDRKDILIGTMNLDPRSVELNTEIALVIHNPLLAQQLVAIFDHATQPSSSYHVTLSNDDSHLEWLGKEDGQETDYHSDPKAGFWRNAEVFFYGILPFENQL